ncbi:MAG: hypothetical protein M1834_000897 [Cirrosporium novae-zelandiae]|nr:MAG: hypothetical protein M1834_000897 [Cirrosporium novae-zelandiae]
MAETAQKTRPEKPDEDQFKIDLAKAEKEHAAVQEQLNAVKAKIDLTRNRDKDSPVATRQQELRSQLTAIREQQAGFKQSRGSVQEKINSLDTNLKSRIAEQKNARSRVPFKSVEEVDREIARLEKQVDAGTMKLVDEKKALSEISSLRKQRKGFAGFDEAQKGIDEVKKQISELKKGMDNPESKALAEKYNAIAKELDQIRSEKNEAFQNLNELRDERTRIHDEQNKKWTAIKEIKDKYYGARKAYKEFEDELYRARRERQKAEREAYEKDKRRKIAEQKLEEASTPAFADEIGTAEGLIRYLDPTALPVTTTTEESKFAAQAQRHVDDSNMKGMKVLKKSEEDFFIGSGGKKGKKGKKGHSGQAASPATSTTINLSIGVIEDFARVNIEPPASHADVPAVVEKLKGKLESWKKDQEKKTKENIAKAQKEIERLEKEAEESNTTASSSKPANRRAHDNSKKPASANAGVNGHVSADAEYAQEVDAVADVVDEMKEAAIEDKAE